jgi:hypothetical protein
MYVTRLSRLLDDDAFIPGSVTEIAAICDEWFSADPSLVPFAFRAIFRELDARDWAEQAVPTAVFKQFKAEVLPAMRATLAGHVENHKSTLLNVVRAFHQIVTP